jgi:hypothetical protein
MKEQIMSLMKRLNVGNVEAAQLIKCHGSTLERLLSGQIALPEILPVLKERLERSQ